MYTAKQMDLFNDTLCDRCGRQTNCSILKNIEQHNKVSSILVVNCEDYVLPLKFRDTSGTDDGHWNTIRLGKSWANRIHRDDTVAIIDSDNNISGYAWVVEVEFGATMKMIKNHWAMNHLAIEGKVNGPKEMEKELIKSYSNMVFDNNAISTVIYLKTL